MLYLAARLIVGDIPAQKDFYGKTISEAQYVIPFGDTNESLYIHQKTNTDLTGIDSFFVGVGDTDTEAMRDLLTQGATNCVPLNLNKGEATDANENLYGVDRAVAALNKAKDGSPQTLLETVHDDIRRFVGDEEQFDDLTMICVEYFGKPKDN